jgi:uncharacterized protein YifN (PemK superfamily)
VPNTFQVVANNDSDEKALQQIAAMLRSNDRSAAQIREFLATINSDTLPQGLRFTPRPGTLLICHFGLGFMRPEIVKVRPVLVISRQPRNNTGLCTVVPISSKAPNDPQPYHYRLPEGTVPGKKYSESWLKGDLIQTVSLARLDRIKIGKRQYAAPIVSDEVMVEARKCVLHAQDMHHLTNHL